MTNHLHYYPDSVALNFCHNELQEALERGEFAPYFQPIVDGNGVWRGAEILMRWCHPEYGVLPPSAFLAQLEQSELLLAATKDILKCATTQWRAQPSQQSRSFFVSFNACLAHLQSATLSADCGDFLKQLTHQHLALMVEMPERGADIATQHCETLFHELQQVGVTVALDDFGVGDARLHQFVCGPISCVKIDRSFVKEIEVNALYRKMVSKIVDFAAAFGAHVTAEGVETRQQHRWLRRLGVTLFQGYLFDKPLPAKDFFHRLPAMRAY